MNKKIAIIGAGNIGCSIAMGLKKAGLVEAGHIHVTRRAGDSLADLVDEGFVAGYDNVEAVAAADIVVLSVKPFKCESILNEIKPALDPAKHLLVSVVSGKGSEDIFRVISRDIPLFLVMPNTAISIQESMTCIATPNANSEQRGLIKGVFDKLGLTLFVEEELMGAATVLASCGIAFAFRFIRAASQGGIEIGFGADKAQLIAAQIAKGAAELILKSGHHPEKEIDKVTTPQGVTISGLNEMEHQGFSSSLIKGIVASFDKVKSNK